MSENSGTLLVALSAGGTNAELAAHGIGVEHVEELMVRIAMRLLSDGHRLAFGGTLGVADQPLTQQLIDTAQRWMNETTATNVDITKPETWPLVNYSAWPHYQRISQEQRARLVGICQFLDIDPDGMSPEELHKISDDDRALRDRRGADALTTMRNRAAVDTELRIVWGGKIHGASGWMAGILEEVVSSLKRNKPVLVLGGFGGCARVLAEFLNDPQAAWPDQLGLSACANAERDALLSTEDETQLNARMQDAVEVLSDFRSALHIPEKIHGVPSQVLKSALLVDSPREAINVAAKVAELVSTRVRGSGVE